jgi:hypothetical protein
MKGNGTNHWAIYSYGRARRSAADLRYTGVSGCQNHQGVLTYSGVETVKSQKGIDLHAI